ncbi:MAG: hypothetical protein WAQ27_03745, partial [Candidatus Microsaccharimonas sp.]
PYRTPFIGPCVVLESAFLDPQNAPLECLHMKIVDHGNGEEAVMAPLAAFSYLVGRNSTRYVSIRDVTKDRPTELRYQMFSFGWNQFPRETFDETIHEIQLRLRALGTRMADEDPWFVEHGSVVATLS